MIPNNPFWCFHFPFLFLFSLPLFVGRFHCLHSLCRNYVIQCFTFFFFFIGRHLLVGWFDCKHCRNYVIQCFHFHFLFLFLVGAFLWVGLIVYILFAGTMLFNVSLSLSFSFFGRRLFVGWFDWEGGALECRTIDCRLRIPLGTSK